MRISSDLLFALATVLEGAGRSALLDGSEAQPGIPSTINPVLVIPGPLRGLGNFTATDVKRESFARDDTSARSNQASTTTLICTFGAGVWLVQVQLAVLANWTQASDGTLANAPAVVLQDPTNVAEGLLFAHIINGVQTRSEGTWIFAFPDDSWTLRTRLPGNGAGQTHETQTGVVATRLL